MSFYPAKGGDGKSPLNREFQVIGYSFLGDPRTQTVSTTITDADFIVIMSFYKTSSISSTFTIKKTNQCVGTIGKVGDSATIIGESDFVNKDNTNIGTGVFTWESPNIVKLEGSCSGAIAIYFCKYV